MTITRAEIHNVPREWSERSRDIYLERIAMGVAETSNDDVTREIWAAAYAAAEENHRWEMEQETKI